jgi:uncharacterized protein
VSDEENKLTSANIDLIKSLYAAFGRGDIETIIAALAPNVDWAVTGRREDYPLFGGWSGQSECGDSFRACGSRKQWISRLGNSLASRIGCLFSGIMHGRSARAGRTVASDWVHIFTIANGKIIKFREFTDTAQFAAAYRA